jgi:hypothetical protein
MMTMMTLHEDDWEPKLIYISIYTCHQLTSPVGEQMCKYNPEFVREATAKDISVEMVIFSMMRPYFCFLLAALSSGGHLWGSTSARRWRIQDRHYRLAQRPDVDASIPCRSSQVFVLSVWNVKMGLQVTELRKTEIDDINLIATLADSHEEVVVFDTSMDEVLGMNVVNMRDL